MLTNSALVKAARLNHVWCSKLGIDWPTEAQFSAAGIDAQPVNTPEFATQVAAFQSQNDLVVDGICGPKTSAKIRSGAPWTQPMGTDKLIFGDSLVEVVGLKVLDYKETGLSFGNGNGALGLRSVDVRMGVLHNTAGEGSGHQVWNTLVDRNLSVDFVLDAEGTVYQYTNPPKVYTMHGGWTNSISWGIEITNDMDPLRGSRKRPLIEGTLLGMPHKWDGLLIEQRDALPRLVAALCSMFGLPKRIPSKDGRLLDGPPVPMDMIRAYRSAKKAKNYKEQRRIGDEAIQIMKAKLDGFIVGHYMVSLGGKPDPSPDAFEELLRNGFVLEDI